MVRSFWHPLPGPVRVCASFLGSWHVAVVGTAIAEADIKNFYHPHTFAGEYIREMVPSSLCALLPGVVRVLQVEAPGSEVDLDLRRLLLRLAHRRAFGSKVRWRSGSRKRWGRNDIHGDGGPHRCLFAGSLAS
jgi:hypothetical protein